MSLPEPLSAAGGQALQAIINSPSERRSSRRTSTARAPRSSMIVLGQYGEEALAELSDVIVDGPAGLAAWLNELAEQMEGRA